MAALLSGRPGPAPAAGAATAAVPDEVGFRVSHQEAHRQDASPASIQAAP